MSALKALDAARAAGIEVQLDGKDLVWSAATDPAPALIDMLRRHKRSIVSIMQDRLLALRQPIQPWDPVDWRAFFEERAAIAEFDGGTTRAEAEARAFDCCVAEWLLRDPIESPPDRCLQCGKSRNADDPLLAIGVVGAGEAWLHRECVADWHSVRLAAAVTALRAMNIEHGPADRTTVSRFERSGEP
jgi:hypothetical protein